MNNVELKADILEKLQYGQEHAVKKVELARRCQVNERSMRLLIRELIDDGYPVCGSPHPPHGYFIANSPEEIKAELAILRSYGKELFRRYSKLKKIKASLVLQHPGQMPLGI